MQTLNYSHDTFAITLKTLIAYCYMNKAEVKLSDLNYKTPLVNGRDVWVLGL